MSKGDRDIVEKLGDFLFSEDSLVSTAAMLVLFFGLAVVLGGPFPVRWTRGEGRLVLRETGMP